MADTQTYLERGLSMLRGTNTALKLKANAAIAPNLLLAIDSSGNVGPATAGSARVVGASGDITTAAQYDPVEVLSGHVILTADAGGIVAGYPLKAAASGKATVLIDTALANSTVDTSSAGGAFVLLGQPQNDAIEVLSDNAADTTQSVTVWGTTTATNTVVTETIALNGTTPVASVKTDWGFILAWRLNAACAGTLTIQEASGNVDLTTAAAGVLSQGLDAVTGTTIPMFNAIPYVKSDGATTKVAGIIGTDSTGATIYDSVALNGTTAAAMHSAFQTVTYILTGDVEAARVVLLLLGAEEDDELKVGRAMENQTVAGDTFLAYVTP